jgi:hypothetical protein
MILVKNVRVVVKIPQQDISKCQEWIIRVLNEGVTGSHVVKEILGPLSRIIRI